MRCERCGVERCVGWSGVWAGAVCGLERCVGWSGVWGEMGLGLGMGLWCVLGEMFVDSARLCWGWASGKSTCCTWLCWGCFGGQSTRCTWLCWGCFGG